MCSYSTISCAVGPLQHYYNINLSTASFTIKVGQGQMRSKGKMRFNGLAWLGAGRLLSSVQPGGNVVFPILHSLFDNDPPKALFPGRPKEERPERDSGMLPVVTPL